MTRAEMASRLRVEMQAYKANNGKGATPEEKELSCLAGPGYFRDSVFLALLEETPVNEAFIIPVDEFEIKPPRRSRVDEFAIKPPRRSRNAS